MLRQNGVNAKKQFRRWACILGCGLSLNCSPTPPREIRIAPPEPTLSENVRVLDPAAAKGWMEAHDEAFIIDAREDSEFKEHGRLPKATNLSQLAGDSVLERLADEPQDRPIFIYCALGARSAWLAEQLETKGFTNLQILKGGLHAWKDAGLPVVNP